MGLASGVVAGLDVDEAVPVRRLDQPMLVGEPARPLAGQVLTQGLGLADADSGLAKRLADQPIDTGEHHAIIGPRAVVDPAVIGERDFIRR